MVKAMLVSSTSPSGIIPIIAATVLTIASLKLKLPYKYCFKNNNKPRGIIIILTYFKIIFKLWFNFESCFFNFFASLAILLV